RSLRNNAPIDIPPVTMELHPSIACPSKGIISIFLRRYPPEPRTPERAVVLVDRSSHAQTARFSHRALLSNAIRMIPTTARLTPTTNRIHGLAAGLSASMKNATTADTKPAMTRSQAKACFTRGPSAPEAPRGRRSRLLPRGAGHVGRARATRSPGPGLGGAWL